MCNKLKHEVYETLRAEFIRSGTLYLQRWDVIVRDNLKAGHVGAEAFIAAGVGGAGDGSHGAAPEVSI